MKKLCILLVAALCLALCGCNEADPPANGNVHITAGEIKPGMTAKDILVEVTIDNQPVACRVNLTGFTATGYYEMADDEPVPEDFFVRLNVFYSLPKGMDVDQIEVAMECNGGRYDGTGSFGDDDNGCVEAWSYAFYGEEPQTETEPAAEGKVHITAGEIKPGMTAKDVAVEVTIDGQPVDCRVALTFFTATGYYEMADDEPVPEDFYVRLDVYYSLPQGMDTDQIEVVMECAGGQYDGTGSIGDDDNGCVEAWSYAFYGQEPTVEEPTTGEHTHDWKEDTSKGISPSCTVNGKKVYTCQCGETKQETIPALGHDWEDGIGSKPSCEHEGSSTKVCQRCHEVYMTTIPATGHNWSAWTYVNGRLHGRDCSNCNSHQEENHTIPSGSVTCSGCGMDIIN